jgi:hypothetical protein
MEVAEGQATGLVFHFSEAPTVTTGFIAFVFDIRRDRSRAGFEGSARVDPEGLKARHYRAG